MVETAISHLTSTAAAVFLLLLPFPMTTVAAVPFFVKIFVSTGLAHGKNALTPRTLSYKCPINCANYDGDYNDERYKAGVHCLIPIDVRDKR